MSCCAKPALGSFPVSAVLGAEAADGAGRAQSTLVPALPATWHRRVGRMPPLVGGTLSVVFYLAWHCVGSCSSFHFKQSKFTGGLYLPLTPSYTITLVGFYLQLLKNRVE